MTTRTFAYCRVSTLGQTVENQVREIEVAGFAVEKRRTVTETVSGSSAIEQRPGFMKLLDRLERDDVHLAGGAGEIDTTEREAMHAHAHRLQLADRRLNIDRVAAQAIQFRHHERSVRWPER
jgi:putative DNA-invertase from lambdoid prophage Rac